MSRKTEKNQPPEQVPGFYLDSFGFTERPFTLVPDPAFLYWSDQHKRAFSVLEFGILSRAPITLVTGSVGCGKTTLLRQLLKHVEADSVIGLISNAQGDRGELIQWVLHSLGVKFDPEDGYVSQFQILQDFLIQTYAEGRRVILIFDEAQNLSEGSLEELRMLTNINSNKDELIQLVLVGQEELRDMIKKPALRQLAQRIAASFHLKPLTEAATNEFIVHRLRVAGGTGDEIDEKAKMLIYEVSHGTPRLVNQVCDMSLLYAWSAETKVVDAKVVQAVIDDGVFFGAEVAADEAAE
ncbi:MAG: ATPase [Marinosulfonomonas sp.]|uniref:ExeA family protein n=1 Tax=Methylophaga sp. TaxID=2024840 RepID=UPI000C111CC1|nr:AAA family ATPase [Methylophaga sp.]MBL1456730.1 AAA family ATPase [Methylophaga sp.]PHQ94209.1 MAG: ATPase [Marinosulfonomonas sp.]